jgi:predicted GTPase
MRGNKMVEGMNEHNTNYLEIGKAKESDLELKPIQHPLSLNEPDTSIVSYKVPPKNLSPYYHIPDAALAPITIKNFDSPIGAKHLEVCILGAPNAGKSSILNFMTGRSISAVSNKYNTTDEPILGVYTDYDTKS